MTLKVYKLKFNNKDISHHARWVNCESTEHPTISVFILRNSSARSLKAMISVGQTKVLKIMFLRVKWKSKFAHRSKIIREWPQENIHREHQIWPNTPILSFRELTVTLIFSHQSKSSWKSFDGLYWGWGGGGVGGER